MQEPNFFTVTRDIDETSDDVEEYDSILSLCKGYLPVFSLKWHYRSRHEDLITFSNQQFYTPKGSPPGLITFPSSQNTDDFGLQYHHIPNGVFRSGKERNNLVEATKVAERVVYHLKKNPHKSLGVIAFNSSQQVLIEEQIQKLCDANESIKNPLDDERRLDGFFVKNLENVQGDEREIILLSVGYGPPQIGIPTALRFLHKQGDWKRLNVAITRAKQKMEIFCSFTNLCFSKLGSSKNKNHQHLHKYLKYCQEPNRSKLQVFDIERPIENFEQVIGELIESWGYEIDYQIGKGSYRVDIGIKAPNDSDIFVVGIKCDGRMYASSQVTRDRDRLRTQVLLGLGWEIYHVWSLGWTLSREKQETSLQEFIQQAIERYENPQNIEAIPTGSNIAPVAEMEKNELTAVKEVQRNWIGIYRTFINTIAKIENPTSNHHQPDMEKVIRNIMQLECPITQEYLEKRSAEVIGVRNTKKFKQTVGRYAREICENSKFQYITEEKTYVKEGYTIFFRRNYKGQLGRKIEDYPPIECDVFVLEVVKEVLSTDTQELVEELKKVLQMNRITSALKNMVSNSIERLYRKGVLKKEKHKIIYVSEIT